MKESQRIGLGKCVITANVYGVTRTRYKPALKWVLWCTDMHCQHQRKPPFVTRNLTHWWKISTKRKLDVHHHLFSKLKILPAKKITHTNFCIPHKGHLELDYNHNHSIHLAHTLGFQPISLETKENYAKLFSKPASAHLYYENYLMDEFADDVQTKVADRV